MHPDNPNRHRVKPDECMHDFDDDPACIECGARASLVVAMDQEEARADERKKTIAQIVSWMREPSNWLFPYELKREGIARAIERGEFVPTANAEKT